jgi:hypothetical protein
MTLLGCLNGLSYIYNPSHPFKFSKFSKFSHSSPLRYTVHDTSSSLTYYSVHEKINKQLNYWPRLKHISHTNKHEGERKD